MQSGIGVAQPAGLGGEPEQRLHHHQGDQFGVGELRADPDFRAPGRCCGLSISKSSMVTYSAVARVSRSASTTSLQGLIVR